MVLHQEGGKPFGKGLVSHPVSRSNGVRTRPKRGRETRRVERLRGEAKEAESGSKPRKKRKWVVEAMGLNADNRYKRDRQDEWLYPPRGRRRHRATHNEEGITRWVGGVLGSGV